MALNHEIISESVLFNAILSPSWLGPVIIMLVSSAKNATLESLLSWVSRLRKWERAMGPRSNPEEPHNKTIITCGAKTVYI